MGSKGVPGKDVYSPWRRTVDLQTGLQLVPSSCRCILRSLLRYQRRQSRHLCAQSPRVSYILLGVSSPWCCSRFSQCVSNYYLQDATVSKVWTAGGCPPSPCSTALPTRMPNWCSLIANARIASPTWFPSCARQTYPSSWSWTRRTFGQSGKECIPGKRLAYSGAFSR